MKKKDQRQSLTLRCRANPTDPLARVIDWLKDLDSRDRKDKVDRMLLALLPYAFEADEKTKEEIEHCYWDVYERLHDYLFVMRQTLGIKVPNKSLISYSERNISADTPEEPAVSEEKNSQRKQVFQISIQLLELKQENI